VSAMPAYQGVSKWRAMPGVGGFFKYRANRKSLIGPGGQENVKSKFPGCFT